MYERYFDFGLDLHRVIAFARYIQDTIHSACTIHERAAERAAVERSADAGAAVKRAAVERAAVERAAFKRAAFEPAAVEQAAVERTAVERAAIVPAANERMSCKASVSRRNKRQSGRTSECRQQVAAQHVATAGSSTACGNGR